LRLRLDERKVIERAKGALMRRYNLSEEAAFQRLRRAAVDSRRSMADISRALLVSEAVAGNVPAEEAVVQVVILVIHCIACEHSPYVARTPARSRKEQSICSARGKSHWA